MLRTTAVGLASLGMSAPPCPRRARSWLTLVHSFDSREVCEEIIRKFHGMPLGEEGLLLQVRYADTPAQKDLKRITTERRQFRTNEYNVGAYGGPVEMMALSPSMPAQMHTPIVPRTTQLSSHFPSRANGSWKRRDNG